MARIVEWIDDIDIRDKTKLLYRARLFHAVIEHKEKQQSPELLVNKKENQDDEAI